MISPYRCLLRRRPDVNPMLIVQAMELNLAAASSTGWPSGLASSNPGNPNRCGKTGRARKKNLEFRRRTLRHTTRNDARYFPSCKDQDERSWTPNEADGRGIRPGKPGTHTTGRFALRDGLVSSSWRPTGSRPFEAPRPRVEQRPSQLSPIRPGCPAGRGQLLRSRQTVTPHTDRGSAHATRPL